MFDTQILDWVNNLNKLYNDTQVLLDKNRDKDNKKFNYNNCNFIYFNQIKLGYFGKKCRRHLERFWSCSKCIK